MNTISIATNSHALLFEDLGLREVTASAIVRELRSFAESLGYTKDHIENLECRARDGFIPHAHNHGGLGCLAHAGQASLSPGDTGFKGLDKALNRALDFDIADAEERYGKKHVDFSTDELDEFEEARSESEDTVLFSLDMMHTGVTRGRQTINLRFCLCASDSPYHRKFDDKIEANITFKTVAELKTKLAKIRKTKQVEKFSRLVSEYGY